MEEIKIGDDVLVKGKVIEIRHTAKGKVLRIDIKNKITFSDAINVDYENIHNLNTN